MGFGYFELALSARCLAESYLREDLPGLVALLDREAHGPFEELAGLGQVTGLHRAPAQPRQSIGGLWPQAKLFGHVQAFSVQPTSMLVVSCCGLRGAEPFDGLQLPPSVPELAEYRQALLGITPRGGGVAADHRQLGAGAQGRSDSPLVAERPEACKRLTDHGLARGWVAEIRCDKGVEPFQGGPDRGVVDAAKGLGGGVFATLSGEGCETAPPGGGSGPCGGGSVAEGKCLIQGAPCFCYPAAQEPVPRQGVDHTEGGSGVAVVGRRIEGIAQVGGLGV